jgi:hypothetical protein
LGALSQVLLFPDADRERAGNRLLDYADEVSPRKRGNPLLEDEIRAHVRDNSLAAQLGEIGRQGRAVRDNIGPWAKSLPGRVGNFVVDEGKRLGGTIGGIIDNEIDPMSDEAIQAVFETTGLLALQAPMAGPRGALGVFGGRMAKTADRDALARAERMAEAGADRRAIWDETGWFKGPDGKWRFEIDDSGAKYTPDFEGSRVPDAMQHEQLFEAYPQMRDMPAERVSPPDALGGGRSYSGAYSPESGVSIHDELGRKTGRSTFLHELQHGVQDTERFAQGGNPSMARGMSAETYSKDIREVESLIEQVRAKAQSPGGIDATEQEFLAEMMQELEQLRQKAASRPATAFDAYRNLAGEVEARNVETRRDFTPEQRRAQAPWETQDVPDDLQIVRMGGDGPQQSVPLRGGGESNPLLTGWTFRDVVRKPELSAAENRRFSAGAATHDSVELPIRRLFATQDSVNPDFASTQTSAGELPFVIRKDGKFYVTDGHHRIVRAAEDGAENARVRLLDFDGADDTPLLDYRPKSKSDLDEIEALYRELGLSD